MESTPHHYEYTKLEFETVMRYYREHFGHDMPGTGDTPERYAAALQALADDAPVTELLPDA